ncbi:MAG: fatty acid desaturase [Cypionkella sp.]|nr:fatty acid desaturase [Cypionkella sp.]
MAYIPPHDFAPASRIEWPTLAVFAGTYAVLASGFWLWPHAPLLSIAVLAIALAQYSSLQHEVLHGHPFSRQWVSEALVFPALFVVVPYMRFKDTHLAHHYDPALTDPYDDPESNFFDPSVWVRQPRLWQRILLANNTLAGQIFLGPAIGMYYFLRGEVRALMAGQRRVWLAWALNALGMIPLIWALHIASFPAWAYAIAVYLGLGLLRIRTFLEHRAHASHCARTVVVEDRGPLALLFLNNNFHVVHHMHPNVAWYDLPKLYKSKRDHYLRRNDGYRYKNYAEVFARYFWRAKDPVPHPIFPVVKDRPKGEAALD